MKNSFEQNPSGDRDSAMRERLEVVMGDFDKRAERDCLEIEPVISYDEATLTVSVEILLRPIPSDLDIECERNIFEGQFRSDEWSFASPERISSWQKEIEENYLKASRDIFVIAGRKALFRAADAEKKLEKVPSEPIPINAKPPKKDDEKRRFAQAA